MTIDTSNMSSTVVALIQEGLAPQDDSERRSGVDLDVAAMRIMLAKGTDSDKDAALRAVATAADRGTATRHDGAYVASTRRLRPPTA